MPPPQTTRDSSLDFSRLVEEDAKEAASTSPDYASERENESFDERGVRRVYHYCLRGIVIAASILFGVLLLAERFRW